MARTRVHDLAKELNISTKELMEKMAELGIPFKNHMSILSTSDVNYLRRFFKKFSKSSSIMNDGAVTARRIIVRKRAKVEEEEEEPTDVGAAVEPLETQRGEEKHGEAVAEVVEAPAPDEMRESEVSLSLVEQLSPIASEEETMAAPPHALPDEPIITQPLEEHKEVYGDVSSPTATAPVVEVIEGGGEAVIAEGILPEERDVTYGMDEARGEGMPGAHAFLDDTIPSVLPPQEPAAGTTPPPRLLRFRLGWGR